MNLVENNKNLSTKYNTIGILWTNSTQDWSTAVLSLLEQGTGRINFKINVGIIIISFVGIWPNTLQCILQFVVYIKYFHNFHVIE